MQPRFSKKELRPFVIQFCKRFGHFGMEGSMCDGNRRLDKKSFFEKFQLIAQTIGHKELITTRYFSFVIVRKSLRCVQDMNSSVCSFPPKSLIGKPNTKLSDGARKFLVRGVERFSERYTQWPCILPRNCFNRNNVFWRYPIAEIELNKIGLVGS